MRPFALAALLLAPSFTGPAAAAQATTPTYTLGWQDAASVGGAALLALAGHHATPPAASCAPCDPASLPGIDRGTVGNSSSAARTASDLTLVAVLGGSALASISGVSPERARGDVAVLANAVSWDAAATEWAKQLLHRSRPVLYGPDAAAAAADPDNRKSFPSGHTSMAFAAATSYAVMAGRQHLPHATRNTVLLYAGATAVGALRVAAGKHFPTDVLAGAALGSTIGWAVARLHPMTTP